MNQSIASIQRPLFNLPCGCSRALRESLSSFLFICSCWDVSAFLDRTEHNDDCVWRYEFGVDGWIAGQYMRCARLCDLCPLLAALFISDCCRVQLIVVSFLMAGSDVGKKPLMKMVCYMAVCDFLLSFKYFLPAVSGTLDGDDYRPNTAWCDFEGVFSQFFGTATVSWYMCIAVSTFFALTRPLQFQGSSQYMPIYHIGVWGLSAFSTIMIWTNVGWGTSGDGTCWISDRYVNWRLWFYVPLFVYLLFAMVLMGYILYYRRLLSFGNPNHLVARMLAFVLVFLLTWVGVSIQRLYEYFSSSTTSPESLLIPHCIAVSGSGFGNFCVWVSSPQFEHLRCGWCKRNPGSASWSEKLSSYPESEGLSGAEDESELPVSSAPPD